MNFVVVPIDLLDETNDSDDDKEDDKEEDDKEEDKEDKKEASAAALPPLMMNTLLRSDIIVI